MQCHDFYKVIRTSSYTAQNWIKNVHFEFNGQTCEGYKVASQAAGTIIQLFFALPGFSLCPVTHLGAVCVVWRKILCLVGTGLLCSFTPRSFLNLLWNFCFWYWEVSLTQWFKCYYPTQSKWAHHNSWLNSLPKVTLDNKFLIRNSS